MFLEEIKIAGFKNIEHAKLHFNPKINCLTGLNGVGKTNCLDAVFLLCVGKSHFNLTEQQLIKQGGNFFRVEGLFTNDNNDRKKVVIKLQDSGKKNISLDDKPYKKIAEHLGRFPVVMIAPDDTEIICGSSEVRRKFLDTTLCQTDRTYLDALTAYNKILKQRNAYLKMLSASGGADNDLLETYDKQLATPAHIIHDKRMKYTAELDTVFIEKFSSITSGDELVKTYYQSQLSDMSMVDLLANNRRKDLITERTNAGIHKDELQISIETREARKFASQGQQKSLLFALKFAEYTLLMRHTKVKPILLLDDIFDKLDDIRVRNLLGILKNGIFGQVFITDTSADRIKSVFSGTFDHFSLFAVEHGHLKAES
ncbi:MAG TPA: DNA replication and repair protein RecF [Saprospiraceae bacterium]|nr:DNA replication and repair protein RecF [Saprospiraceae bacterium]